MRRHRALMPTIVFWLVLAGCAGGSGDDIPTPLADDSAASTLESATITVAVWQGQTELWDQVLAVFEAEHPHIDAVYQAVDPVGYDDFLDTAFETGSGPDVYGCRGYDWALGRFDAGQLADISDLRGIDNFTAKALSTWSTDDGAITYCVPAIANMTGFFYNIDVFDELNLAPPTTEAEFYAVLEAVKADGRYVPLALGLGSAWVGNGLGYENIGTPHWRGEEGRLALIARSASFTDAEFVAPFEQLARWVDYLPDGAAGMSRIDGQGLFMTGQAAMAPAGSWEIEPANNTGLNVGALPPMLSDAGGQCFVTEHPDLGIGLNPASDVPDAARQFLEWTTGPGFASAYMEAFPGLFTLQRESPEVDDPLATEFLAWRERCETSPRLTGQILSRGDINLEAELAVTSIKVLAGELDPNDAAEAMQAVFGSDG